MREGNPAPTHHEPPFSGGFCVCPGLLPEAGYSPATTPPSIAWILTISSPQSPSPTPVFPPRIRHFSLPLSSTCCFIPVDTLSKPLYFTFVLLVID